MESSLRTGPENAVIPRRPCDAARVVLVLLVVLVLDRQFCDVFWDLCVSNGFSLAEQSTGPHSSSSVRAHFSIRLL